MNTDVVSAPVALPSSAWRSLLWAVPFTALWTWLIYSLPVLLDSGLAALAVRLMVHGLIALGLWLGLERTDLTAGQRRTTWLAIVVPSRFGPRSPGLGPSTVSSALAPCRCRCRCFHWQSSCR